MIHGFAVMNIHTPWEDLIYEIELLNRLGVNYFEKVINDLQLHWKLFN